MFTFQSIMFASLGFLIAVLLGFVIAPAFWARAVRLTTQRIRASLPLTEQEISAERDRLRAENAIRVHQLTARLERARLQEARQKVEINRRDATIGSLERRLSEIETEREGSENARRVLEATITQRIPEVEGRLSEARQLLAKRDAEMRALQSDTGRTFRALDEAMQVNAQQRSEIDRLKMSLSGRGGRLPAAGTESETALRSELDLLRARSRDQADLIKKLQAAQASRSNDEATDRRNNDADAFPYLPVERQAAGDDELKKKIAGQQAEIEKLTAQLDEFHQAANEANASRDSKAALKTNASAAQKEIAQRDETIANLRQELAKANERIARQASYYTDEMRKLGRSQSRPPAASEPAPVTENSTAEPPPLPNGNASPAIVSGAVSRPPATDETNTANRDEAVAALDDARPSLEERLMAEQKSETKEPPPDEPKNKLMDRIAALAKR